MNHAAALPRTRRTVVAFDCGYGIAQVTSGMRRGDTSAFDPNRVASSVFLNSSGAGIRSRRPA